MIRTTNKSNRMQGRPVVPSNGWMNIGMIFTLQLVVICSMKLRTNTSTSTCK